MMVVHVMLAVVLIYMVCGLLFAAAFVLVGVGRVDAAARNTSFGFRLLILPGTAALWPLLAARWLRACREGGRA